MGHAYTLTVTGESVDDAAVLFPDGNLDSSTYRSLRNTIIAAAIEERRAVIVDVSRLAVPAESALTVFTSARWLVGGWPNTPILIVCEHAAGRSSLRRSGVSQRVPVFQSIDEALGTLRPFPDTRHKARAVLLADLSSLSWSRQWVEQWLTAWARAELTCVTQVIATAFVENVLKHTDSKPDVRLETDGAAVTVAVEDGNHALACIRESTVSANRPSGLRVVSSLCRQWGNAPTPTGKAVWAVVGPENRL